MQWIQPLNQKTRKITTVYISKYTWSPFLYVINAITLSGVITLTQGWTIDVRHVHAYVDTYTNFNPMIC